MMVFDILYLLVGVLISAIFITKRLTSLKIELYEKITKFKTNKTSYLFNDGIIPEIKQRFKFSIIKTILVGILSIFIWPAFLIYGLYVMIINTFNKYIDNQVEKIMKVDK